MNRKRKYIKFIGIQLALSMLIGCVEPYSPPVVENINALVIDGFVNTTTKTASVRLSRTIPISSPNVSYPPETNAVVFLEGEDGSDYALPQTQEGYYMKTELSLDEFQKYRLYIVINDSEYRSEYITLTKSPPIDTVTWSVSSANNGINVYISSHDPESKTHYYQWAFAEVWEYTSIYYTDYIVEDGEIREREISEFTNNCWKSANSDKILIESTTRFNADAVHNFPVSFIPKGSEKFEVMYSITVQQRALDEAAYNYLLQLQKTTEDLGGLFDPMPAQIRGNLYNIEDESEPVLGYFKGGSVEEKRIFIVSSTLPQGFAYSKSGSCPTSFLIATALSSLGSDYQVLDTATDEVGRSGYLITPSYCTDCSLSGGGTLTKPVFWP